MQLYLSAVCAIGLFVLSGLIQIGDFLYSPSQTYRKQVDALLNGQLALSKDPQDIQWDYSWTMGGVHQVWGLGVPIWQVPWAGLAKLFHFESFPERPIFAFFAFVVSFSMLSLVGEAFRQHGHRAVAIWSTTLTLVVIWFPPVVSMLQMRFAQWEEAVAYAYLFSVLQLSCLIGVILKPTFARWLFLCGLAGFGAFIRPTLVFYGAASILCGGLVLWSCRSRWMSGSSQLNGLKFVAGPILFCLFGSLLWWTNFERFGDGFEFGHAVNLQTTTDARYATIFGLPFEDTSISEAAKELYGALFMPKDLNGEDTLAAGIFWGQSDYVRWREFSFDTYNHGYLVLLVLGWGAAFYQFQRYRVERLNTGSGTENGDEMVQGRFGLLYGILGLWSSVAFVLLFIFYLWVPWLTSRYMVDFGGVFVASAILILFGLVRKSQSIRRTQFLVVSVLAIWVIDLVGREHTGAGWRAVPPYTQIVENSLSPDDEILRRLGRGYVEMGDPVSGLPFDRQGWDQDSGTLRSLFIVFVQDAEFLELNLLTNAEFEEKEVRESFRAKLGTEFLALRRVEQRGTKWIIKFDGPKLSRFKTGIQTVFVTTLPKDQLLETNTPWELESIRWRIGNEEE